MLKYALIMALILLSTITIVNAQSLDTVEERILRHQGQERRFLLYTPPAASDGEPLPLVFVLHGGGGSPEIYQQVTRFTETARNEGFYLVYPAGTGIRFSDHALTWNAGYCCGFARLSNRNEADFFEQMIIRLSAEFDIDTNRIYVAGHSNGGMLVYQLAAELSDVFAAAAVVAAPIGGYSADTPNILQLPPEPANAIPILHIHGMEDALVPYEGGPNGAVDGQRDLSVQDALDFWIKPNECNTTPVSETSEDTLVLRTTYACHETGTSIRLIAIVDGGHAWPGGAFGQHTNNAPSQRVDATEEIWMFFQQYTLNRTVAE